jgi:hypothetical protein
MNLHLRQTGRTTRMLAQAAAMANLGRAVYVYAHHITYVRQLEKQFHGGGRNHASVKFEVLPHDWNWRTMCPNDKAHPNCVFLVDHATVEIHLEEVDKEIMRLQQLARQMYSLTT